MHIIQDNLTIMYRVTFAVTVFVSMLTTLLLFHSETDRKAVIIFDSPKYAKRRGLGKAVSILHACVSKWSEWRAWKSTKEQ